MLPEEQVWSRTRFFARMRASPAHPSTKPAPSDIITMNTLAHKVILITGASSGIGEAGARLLAQRGAREVFKGFSSEFSVSLWFNCGF